MDAQGAKTWHGRPADAFFCDLPRPIWIHVGRIARDRGLGRFLGLPLPGSKVIIGDGPDRDRLERDFPGSRFLGYKFGGDLASYVAGADVFVYPDRIDSFGLIVLRAMAGSLPIAALFEMPRDRDNQPPENCFLDDELSRACERALAASGMGGAVAAA